jgi:hemerythrin-like domain-containing protein
MQSTKLLMAEHEIILQALQVLETIAEDAAAKKDVDLDDIRSLLIFFREFADGSHHVKEEAILFPALIQAGMTLHDGPLRVMTHEHERGRALTAAMNQSLRRNQKEEFVRYAKQYIQLIREHIEKENYVLFEMAESLLSDDDDAKVADAMEHFDLTTVGVRAQERVSSSIENLASKYLAATVK